MDYACTLVQGVEYYKILIAVLSVGLRADSIFRAGSLSVICDKSGLLELRIW